MQDVWICIFDKCSALTQLALGSTNAHLWRHYKAKCYRSDYYWSDNAELYKAFGEIGGDGLTFTRIHRCRFTASRRSVRGNDHLLTRRLQVIDEYCSERWGETYRSFLSGTDHKGALIIKGRFERRDMRRKEFPFDGVFRNKESPYHLGETMLYQEDGGCDGFDLVYMYVTPVFKRGKHEVDVVLKSCREIYSVRFG